MACLVDITDLSVEDIDKIIALAEDIRNNPIKYVESCKHKILATLFYEPSTRTRLSFESAMISLGGSVIGFSRRRTTVMTFRITGILIRRLAVSMIWKSS